MIMLSFLRSWAIPACSAAPWGFRQPMRRRVATVRPSLEYLEDRTVPTIWKVTSTVDDIALPGTLRNAIFNAQNGSTIDLKINQLAGPIVLTHGELDLNKDLTIRATGPGLETVSGGGTSRVFEVDPGALVTLSNLTITGGNGMANSPSGGAAAFDGIGGGVLNYGTLTLSGCTVSGNSATPNSFGDSFGGGIANYGALTVDSSALSSNTAFGCGGGIYNLGGTVMVSNSTLSGNGAHAEGGGIFNTGTVTISGSTLTGNFAFRGGGIFNAGHLTVEGKSTVSGNHAPFGGDLYEDSGGTTLTLLDSTIALIFFA
jgi:hypothetical protein